MVWSARGFVIVLLVFVDSSCTSRLGATGADAAGDTATGDGASDAPPTTGGHFSCSCVCSGGTEVCTYCDDRGCMPDYAACGDFAVPCWPPPPDAATDVIDSGADATTDAIDGSVDGASDVIAGGGDGASD
jgi:hypothetical protein